MAKRVSKETWKEFIDKFSSYEGTVTKLCQENNISKGQFYYNKRNFEEGNEPIFHAISFDEEKAADTKRDSTKTIKIEIGKANIFIPANEIAVLSDIIKELARIC